MMVHCKLHSRLFFHALDICIRGWTFQTNRRGPNRRQRRAHRSTQPRRGFLHLILFAEDEEYTRGTATLDSAPSAAGRQRGPSAQLVLRLSSGLSPLSPPSRRVAAAAGHSSAAAATRAHVTSPSLLRSLTAASIRAGEGRGQAKLLLV